MNIYLNESAAIREYLFCVASYIFGLEVIRVCITHFRLVIEIDLSMAISNRRARRERFNDMVYLGN